MRLTFSTASPMLGAVLTPCSRPNCNAFIRAGENQLPPSFMHALLPGLPLHAPGWVAATESSAQDPIYGTRNMGCSWRLHDTWHTLHDTSATHPVSAGLGLVDEVADGVVSASGACSLVLGCASLHH